MRGKGQLYVLSNVFLKEAPPPPRLIALCNSFWAFGEESVFCLERNCRCPADRLVTVTTILSRLSYLKWSHWFFFIKFLCYSSYLERGKTVMYVHPVGLEWTARSFPIPVLCRPLTFPFLLPPSKGFQSHPTLLSTLLRQLPGWLSVWQFAYIIQDIQWKTEYFKYFSSI